MKQLLLAGTALLAIAVPHSDARAVPFDFTYTGSLVTFMVPTTDTYQILAFGAQGGSVTFLGTIGAGGRGAEIGGDFSLTAGEMLQIAVGGSGVTVGGVSSGGGGGSFVVGPGNTPLVIAGGGGGAGRLAGTALPGQAGLAGRDGGGFFLMVFLMAAPTVMEAAPVSQTVAVAVVAGFLVLAAILLPVALAGVHSRL
jgi:hypothetical protein